MTLRLPFLLLAAGTIAKSTGFRAEPKKPSNATLEGERFGNKERKHQ